MNLIKMSLSAALMIGAVALIRWAAVERLPKRTFLLLWTVVLMRLLLPFSIPAPTSIYSLLPQPDPAMPNRVEAEAEAPLETAENFVPVQSAPPIPETVPDTLPEESMVPTPIPSVPRLSVRGILTGIWAGGACLMAVFFLIGYLRSYLEFRTSLPVHQPRIELWLSQHRLRRPIRIRQFDRIHSPLTYGIFRPVILLPKAVLEQSDQTLHYILTHEYLHIRRFDCLTKLLLAAALCLHWPNPMVWLMYHLMNQDIELSCDEGVLRRLGVENRQSYALALLNLEAQRSGLSPLHTGFNQSAIQERIRAIMKMKQLSLISLSVAASLVIGVTSVFATSAKKETAPEPPAPAEQTSGEAASDSTADQTSDQITSENRSTIRYADLPNPKIEDFGAVNPVEFFQKLQESTGAPIQYDGYTGNIYCDNELIDSLYYLTANGTFTFRSATSDSNQFVESNEDGRRFFSFNSSPTSILSLISLRDHGVQWYGSNIYLYRDKIVNTVIDGSFCSIPNPDGEISLEVLYDDQKFIRGVKVISNKEAEQRSYQILKPDSMTSPLASFQHLNTMTQNKEVFFSYQAAAGTPVVCSVPGHIYEMGMIGSKYFVEILDENGVVWSYQNLDSISVLPGQTLQAGEAIGTTGDRPFELHAFLKYTPLNLAKLASELLPAQK
jgi:beta-lactamase regulating signal transducer with metallopeptidase domain